MKSTLFPNIKRLTSLFCIGIACVTVSVLTLRLTVFSDMAASSAKADSHILSSEQDGYQINSKIYFASSGSKGDVFITNLEGNDYIIKVNITTASNAMILSTGFINPGICIEKTRMNPTGQKLEDGIYDCVAEIVAHDQDSLKMVGSVEIPIQVYVGTRPDKAEAS